MSKSILYIVAPIAITCFAFWAIVTHDGLTNPFFIFLLVVTFGVSPVGSFWMMYMAIRFEKHPFSMLLMAFVPYAFVWYYLERVRPGKLIRRFP
ncbi:MAG: hypothetical protein JWO20_1729 [Candidatus Angelobacter sp.]|jgi:hypothetical protein|nr:hypothetical protein [Candidatus Angelobacter sp.]